LRLIVEQDVVVKFSLPACLAILKNGAPPDFSPSMIAPSIISTRDDEPQGTNGDGLTGLHTGETDQQDDQAPPDPDLGVLLYERLWQLVIRSGLWHLDSISFNEGLAIRGWLIRPQNWFGEETFTVNGLPFTSVEMGDKRPDVVRRLMVDESRVREFRCWIDLDDVPNRSEGFACTARKMRVRLSDTGLTSTETSSTRSIGPSERRSTTSGL
jgi:hypothetical protein